MQISLNFATLLNYSMFSDRDRFSAGKEQIFLSDVAETWTSKAVFLGSDSGNAIEGVASFHSTGYLF